MVSDKLKGARHAAVRQAMRKLRIIGLIVPLLVMVWIIVPRAETRLYPVVTEVTVLSATDAGGGWTRLEVEADKLRDCDWRGISWFMGRRGGRSAPVRAYFSDPPQIRHVGRLHWSGLMVELPRDVVLRHSYGDVLHECWGPMLGQTRSRFFTGPEVVR